MSNKTLLALSFFMALVLWVHVYTTHRHDVNVEVPITMTGEREGTMAFLTPPVATVRASIPQSFLSRTGDVKITLAIEDYPVGKHSVILTPSNVAAQDFEVLEIKPANFMLEVAETMKKSLKVVPTTTGIPPPGFITQKIVAVPNTVMVEGLREELSVTNTIRTSPVSLSDMRQSAEFSVDFQRSEKIKNVVPALALVNIEIKTVDVVRRLSVDLRCAEGRKKVTGVPQIILSVSGRSDIVESLSKDSELAVVDCEGLKQGIAAVVAPENDGTLRIWGFEPEYIKTESAGTPTP